MPAMRLIIVFWKTGGGSTFDELKDQFGIRLPIAHYDCQPGLLQWKLLQFYHIFRMVNFTSVGV
jgi:hypothetical protein